MAKRPWWQQYAISYDVEINATIQKIKYVQNLIGASTSSQTTLEMSYVLSELVERLVAVRDTYRETAAGNQVTYTPRSSYRGTTSQQDISKETESKTKENTTNTTSSTLNVNNYPDVESYVYDYMTKKWGLTRAQAAGIMGNIQAESGFKATNAEDSYGYRGSENPEYINRYNVKDGVGWGICQWTYHTRKQGLLDYANSKGTDVGDLETQLEFLYKELSSGKVLENIKKTTTVQEATEVFMKQFERPADQSAAAVRKRCNYSLDFMNRFF